MQWSTYKALCDRPDYWSRWMLDQCMELLRRQDLEALGQVLADAIADQPLDVPADHKGPSETRMHRVDLAPAMRQEILAAVELASVRGIITPQTATRGLGGFVEAWREYAAYVD